MGCLPYHFSVRNLALSDVQILIQNGDKYEDFARQLMEAWHERVKNGLPKKFMLTRNEGWGMVKEIYAKHLSKDGKLRLMADKYHDMVLENTIHDTVRVSLASRLST
ncbi:hypothetical protein QR680_011931 [Steinernema hermaphroditum]|uniref:Uncharacterized protein n=1 Tax=Steinernema hermaphroditum TaxID=289476 RepID=A0AA39I1T6_9BILA|nr:hypothetical protein QR680_011931 [Steinernema hermaphroditum]